MSLLVMELARVCAEEFVVLMVNVIEYKTDLRSDLSQREHNPLSL